MSSKCRFHFFNLIFLICLSLNGCNNEKEKQKLYLFDRFIGSINDYKTYSDFVAITEYQNNTFTISQLVAHAKKYEDTVKADLPVSMVIFVAQKHNQHLPNRGMDSYGRLTRNCILSVTFDNAFPTKTTNREREISTISLWNQGDEVVDFEERSEIDSLLKQTTPISTKF